ncbi:unnamed protein product [Amoebophrya sp. A120]|nr:unnamed protein product [Amoebophrya sp. A120]|eukprot:GSA120T00005092001.1
MAPIDDSGPSNLWEASGEGDQKAVSVFLQSGKYTPISIDQNGYCPMMACISWGQIKFFDWLCSVLENTTIAGLEKMIETEELMLRRQSLGEQDDPYDKSQDSTLFQEQEEGAEAEDTAGAPAKTSSINLASSRTKNAEDDSDSYMQDVEVSEFAQQDELHNDDSMMVDESADGNAAAEHSSSSSSASLSNDVAASAGGSTSRSANSAHPSTSASTAAAPSAGKNASNIENDGVVLAEGSFTENDDPEKYLEYLKNIDAHTIEEYRGFVLTLARLRQLLMKEQQRVKTEQTDSKSNSCATTERPQGKADENAKQGIMLDFSKHNLSKSGQFSIVEIALQATDNEGDTPYHHFATSLSDVQPPNARQMLVERFKKYNCSPETKNLECQTAFDMVLEHDFEEAEWFFQVHGKEAPDELPEEGGLDAGDGGDFGYGDGYDEEYDSEGEFGDGNVQLE